MITKPGLDTGVMPTFQAVGPFNMLGPGSIFVWSPIMRMQKASRSHAKASGGEFE